MNRERSFGKCHQNQTANIISTSDEETKMSRFGRLRQDYHNAVDCVTHGEYIIKTLHELLASKDETIASLEEMLVEMSLKLALSKAFEDEHRAKRRISSVDAISVDISDETRPPSSQADNKLLGRAVLMPLDSNVVETTTPNRRQSHADKIMPHEMNGRQGPLADSTSSRQSNFDFGQLFRKSKQGDFPEDCPNDHDTLDGSGRESSTQGDSSSSRLENFRVRVRQLFRINRSPRELKGCALQEDFPKVNDEKREEEGNDGERPRRRPTNQRRTMTRQPSSRSFLGSGVIFPVTFEDCLEGCIDRSISSSSGAWK